LRPALEVRSGTVWWHGKDRDEVYRRAVAIRPKRFAIVYTGKNASGHCDRIVNFVFDPDFLRGLNLEIDLRAGAT
jgi:hypothetical protein